MNRTQDKTNYNINVQHDFLVLDVIRYIKGIVSWHKDYFQEINVIRDVITPTRLKTHTEFSVNG